MKFCIENRWTGATIFKAELEAHYESDPRNIQLGAAVRLAFKAGANLAGAYLARAYLAGAKWRDGITINKTPIQIYGLTWPVYILDRHMQIGYELHSHEDWSGFGDDRIKRMDPDAALSFSQAHKDWLLALCRQHAEQEAKAA